MSLTLESPIVCEIPGCTTTQTEIEAELATFLASFCSVCKKDRGGKLCSCAFPCSLTFKSQMLLKIHELMGIDKPTDRRAIQVCFKHPDLLKQAREACVAKRDETSRQKRKNSSSAARTSLNAIKPKSAKITKSDHDAPKMCKIQFQDDESGKSSEDEEFADISEALTSRSSLAINPSTSKSVTVKFRLESLSDSDPEDSTSLHSSDQEDDLQRKLCEIFGNEDSQHSTNSSTTSSNSNFRFLLEKSSKVMKIHYQDYYKRILATEMKSIMHQSYLNDVEFVCKDGNVQANSLILGSMSNYLYNILTQVPIVDKVKIVIMPDVSSVDLNALFKVLFNDPSQTVSIKDMKRIKNIAGLFKLEPILVLTRKPGRPKGSLNKPKATNTTNTNPIRPTQITQQQPVHFEAEKLEPIRKTFSSLRREEAELSEASVSESLEIFAANLQQRCEEETRTRTTTEASGNDHLPLLPSNDLLDQIVQDT